MQAYISKFGIQLNPIASIGRALRRRHCVGGGAPVNFGRPPKNRRRRGVGGEVL